MLKKAFLSGFLLVSGLLLSGCSLKAKPAALQINTTPEANVFIDGKLLGKTPFTSDNFKTSEVVVKLIPDSISETLVSWEGKVKLTGGVLTLIDREFGSSEAVSSGQILNLEKNKDKNSALFSFVTEPDGVLVKIDGETKGFSPLNLEGISPGEHEISFSKEGYKEKVLKAKNVLGYRLIINVKLGQQEIENNEPVVVPEEENSSTPSAGQKTTPASKPTLASSGPAPDKPYVVISETETGFLRVRTSPSGTEVTQVKPGEKYSFLEENNGWYKIIYSADKEGWISAKYAELVE